MGGAFYPIAAHRHLVEEHYGEDHYFTLAPVEERSMASHRHFMAVVAVAFDNLPEDIAPRFASPDALRKHALVRTGYRKETTAIFSTPEDAARAEAIFKAIDDFSVVLVNGCVVTRLTPESQSLAEMGAERFNASKNAVLDFLATLLGVDATTLLKEG